MDHHSHKKKRINEIEKQLLPRLRLMGMFILFFCAISLGYATISSEYVPPPEDELKTPDDLEQSSGIFGPIKSPFLTLTPNERMKCLILSGVFAGIGGTCFILAHRKKKQLDREEHS